MNIIHTLLTCHSRARAEFCYHMILDMSNVGHGEATFEEVIEIAKIAFGCVVDKIDGL